MTAILENYVDTAAEEHQPEFDFISDVETTCRICYAEFLDFEDLNVHINQVHKNTSCLKNCQFCDATYTDLDGYAIHIRDHHLLQLKCCRGCNKCFTDKKLAKKHEKKHFNSKSNMYACSQCDSLFTTIKELECHELHKHDNQVEGVLIKCMPHLSANLRLNALEMLQDEDLAFTCHSCKFTSLDLTIYLDHLNDGKCNITVCDKCSNTFKDKRSLLRHLQRKNKCMDLGEYVSDLIVCLTCKNEVHGKQMRAHQKVCKVFICNPCDMRFETINELSSHQMRTHPLELNVIVCKYCPKEYVGQDALDKHVERTHQHQFILYKYACKSCDAIFKHPKVLFAHYFTKHKDLEPYTCKICDKKFRIRKRFTIHIKLEHKGEGAIEFDENYHVFFAEKKSEKPFIPTCVIPELVPAKDKNSNVGKNKQDSKHKTNDEDTDVPDNLELSAIETEGGEDNANKNTTVKCKKLKRRSKNVVTISSSSDDEAEPLLVMKKRAQRRQFQRRYQPGLKKFKKQMQNRQQFTCKKCKKYCYTYQNYHNHLKMHSKKKFVDCVKCSKSFPSKKELTDHVAKDHATSKLIETLKSVLERKQSENHNVDNDISDSELDPSQKFRRTIKKVKPDKICEPATITIVNENDLSVKKFIENFIPDVNDTTNDMKSDSGVTMKQYNSPFYRKNTIKMYKFTPEPQIKEVKLRMPEKFKSENEPKVKLKVKLIQCPIKPSMFETYEVTNNYENAESFQDYDNYEECRNEAIPEVAQEVMLEGSDEPHYKPEVKAPQKIVIPKLPQGYPSIHIGTLSTEAPFFKIIKVQGSKTHPTVIETNKKLTEDEKTHTQSAKDNNVISLPDGSKFVTANPLAHLLGNRQVEDVIEPLKNKYYKSKMDFKGLLVEAFQNMDKPPKRKIETKQKVEKTKKRKCVAKSP